MGRLSGLVAKRPLPGAAINARYYATDTKTIYVSAGRIWKPTYTLQQDQAASFDDGNLAERPEAGTCIGTLFTDESGLQYEAFPTAWAAVNLEDSIAYFGSPGQTSFHGDALQIFLDLGWGQPGIATDHIISGSGDTNPNIDLLHRKIIAEDGTTVQIDYSDPLGPIFTNLQTTDPHIAGMLWNNAGIPNISAG